MNYKGWNRGVQNNAHFVYPAEMSDNAVALFPTVYAWETKIREDGLIDMRFELSTTRSSATLKLFGRKIDGNNIVVHELGKCVFSKTHKTIKEDTLTAVLKEEFDTLYQRRDEMMRHELISPKAVDEVLAFVGIVMPLRSPYAYSAAQTAKAFNKAFLPDDSVYLQWLQVYNIWHFCIVDPNNFEKLCKQASKVVRHSFRAERAENVTASTAGISKKLPQKLVGWANKQRASTQLLALLNTICENEDGNNAIIFSEYVNSLRRARINQYYTAQLTPEKFYTSLAEILKMDNRYRIKPLVEYLIRQSFYYGSFEGQMQETEMLRDYARLAINANLPFEHYPQNVFKAHNVMLRNASCLTLSAEDEAEFNKICEENKKYEATTEGYSVVMPSCATDVVNEGNALSHCVAGYVPMILRKETIVGFLRKETDKGTSLYTIEIKGRKVIQAKGKFDADVDDEIWDVIHHMERFWVARSI